LALILLGVSGAWIGNLTALEPYKPLFAVATSVFVGFGFWHVYFKPKQACADGSYCARPEAPFVTKAALWLAAVLVALSITIDWWAPLFY
jgi:mercuric ion transport protein